MHPWNVGDRAIYVAGPPSWRDAVGKLVDVVAVGFAKDGTPCAVIQRRDTGEKTNVTADEHHTNIRPASFGSEE